MCDVSLQIRDSKTGYEVFTGKSGGHTREVGLTQTNPRREKGKKTSNKAKSKTIEINTRKQKCWKVMKTQSGRGTETRGIYMPVWGSMIARPVVGE